jgi:hypothetical protein
MYAINREDLAIAIEDGDLQVRAGAYGELTVGFFRLPAGTDLRPALKGLPGDACPCPHWGYMLKGRLRMHTADGHTDFAAGQAFYWAPGHGPEALEDCEYVDFSPSAELQHVVEHITSGAAANA